LACINEIGFPNQADGGSLSRERLLELKELIEFIELTAYTAESRPVMGIPRHQKDPKDISSRPFAMLTRVRGVERRGKGGTFLHG
jgi:hypothetical protein